MRDLKLRAATVWALALGATALSGCFDSEGEGKQPEPACCGVELPDAGEGEGTDSAVDVVPDAGRIEGASVEPPDAGVTEVEPAPDAAVVLPPAANTVDLLLMIDNSASMADKQEILELALPDLVERLGRDTDLHIAVISSSLGDIGANSTCEQGGNNDLADMAHTIGSLPRGANLYSNSPELGFLEWRPGLDKQVFSADFSAMVNRVGDEGCGWEASLESWYRFLADPFPYEALARVPCNEGDTVGNCVEQATDVNGQIALDTTLLAQREAFLRPNSQVAIVMLTDENDCSMQVGNQTWVVASSVGQMYRSTSICESNPNDPCCHICAVSPPAGCTEDPVCDANQDTGALENRLAGSEDALNLRCFQQKRRFGLDFLYPTQRYVNALSQAQLCWSSPDLSVEGCAAENVVANPLYPSGGRLPSQVLFSAIVGVPHQSIASSVDAEGEVLDPGQGILRFKSWQQLTDDGDWAKILGDVGIPFDASAPDTTGTAPTAPTDPYMIESEFERPGIAVNEINGREWDSTGSVGAGGLAPPREDLQYACTFPLLEPKDCSGDNVLNCDCQLGSNDKPLCEEEPGVSQAGTTQYWAKAYPGTRHLEVLKGYGDNSLLASICAKNLTEPERFDYGYRPAITAIVERLEAQREE